MLVSISQNVAVWLSEEEIRVLKQIRDQGRLYSRDMTFNNLEAVTKLHKKSLLRRKNQEDSSFYQVRQGVPPLPF
jgi:hypothetical protein